MYWQRRGLERRARRRGARGADAARWPRRRRRRDRPSASSSRRRLGCRSAARPRATAPARCSMPSSSRRPSAEKPWPPERVCSTAVVDVDVGPAHEAVGDLGVADAGRRARTRSASRRRTRPRSRTRRGRVALEDGDLAVGRSRRMRMAKYSPAGPPPATAMRIASGTPAPGSDAEVGQVLVAQRQAVDRVVHQRQRGARRWRPRSGGRSSFAQRLELVVDGEQPLPRRRSARCPADPCAGSAPAGAPSGASRRSTSAWP